MGFVNYDMGTDFTVQPALAPQAQLTTATAGLPVDTKPTGNNSRTKAVTFIITAGAVTDGTIDFTFEESDASGSGYTAIPAARQFGTSPAFTSATDDRSVAITVVPQKRYCRLNTVETVASAGYFVTAVAMLRTY